MSGKNIRNNLNLDAPQKKRVSGQYRLRLFSIRKKGKKEYECVLKDKDGNSYEAHSQKGFVPGSVLNCRITFKEGSCSVEIAGVYTPDKPVAKKAKKKSPIEVVPQNNPLEIAIRSYSQLYKELFGEEMPVPLIDFKKAIPGPVKLNFMRSFYGKTTYTYGRSQISRYITEIKDQDEAQRASILILNADEYASRARKGLLPPLLNELDDATLSHRLSRYLPVCAVDQIVRYMLVEEIDPTYMKGLAILISSLLYNAENGTENAHVTDTVRVILKRETDIRMLYDNPLTALDDELAKLQSSPIGVFTHVRFSKRKDIIEAYPENGDFFLPWPYVRFENSAIIFEHPRRLGIQDYSLRHSYPASKEVFNYLSPSYFSRFGKVRVMSRGFKIVAILYEAPLRECLSGAEISRAPFVLNEAERLKSRERKYSSSQSIERRLLEKNSTFLRFLSTLQLSTEKYGLVRETTCPQNGAQMIEDAFLFIIGSNDKGYLVVLENENPGKATLLFRIRKDCLQKGLSKIKSFFESAYVNKRETLRDNSLLLQDDVILYCIRVRHEDELSWKTSIRSYLK